MEDEIDPKYVDKADKKDLLQFYGLMGSYAQENSKMVYLGHIESEMGAEEALGAAYHLWKEDILRYNREENKVALEREERDLAKELGIELYRKGRKPEELAGEEWVPEHISNPDTEEEFNALSQSLDQAPDDELYTRIIEALSGRALTPGEVEDELAVEVNFDLEPKLGYMETQSVAKRREDGRYELLPENIDESFFGEDLNIRGVLKEDQRQDNDPWKPDR